MNRRLPQLLAAFVALSTCFAQPVLRPQNAVVNSASFRTPGLPASGIAKGSIFSIFGTGLGPVPYIQADKTPLPTTLGETSVTVTVGGTSVQAIILLAYRYQVNAILPSSTPVGAGSITVTYQGQTSAPAEIQIVNSAFGIYTFNASGAGQAIATHPDYRVNSIIQVFHPGDYATLWGTGLGPIDTSDAAPPPVGNLPGAIKVYVGNTTAAVSYQGRSGCCSGLDQIVFRVPANVQGCYVPVAVEAGGAVSNIATIAVSPSGDTCSDSTMGQDLVNKLAAGERVGFGYVRLESLIGQFMPGSSAYASQDFVNATFSEYTPQTAGLASYGVSPGYCMTVDCSYGCSARSMFGTLSDLSAAQLDAGSEITVQGQILASIPRMGNSGIYGASFNGNISRFLWSVLPYTVSGPGGTRVGSFSATDMTTTAGVRFTNIRSSQNLRLSGDLQLQWSGGDTKLQNGQVTIGAYSGTNTDAGQWVFLQCSAPVSAQSFAIPAWVLSTLPPSGTGVNGTIQYPLGWIWIGQYNNPVTFNAQGLDRGIVTDVFFNSFGVYFQ